MNKKILAAILSAFLLCSCADKPQEQSAESFSETEEAASTSDTAAADTDEIRENSETALAEKTDRIISDNSDDDPVFEEVWLPTSQTKYTSEGETYKVDYYDYDESGIEVRHETKYKQDDISYCTIRSSNSDGTYNCLYTYRDGILINERYYDENGRCFMETDPRTYYLSNQKNLLHEYKYEYDSEERLVKKINFIFGRERIVEYIYDEKGRLYEQHGDGHDNENCIFRCEYGDNTVDVYFSNTKESWSITDRFYKRYEYDESGREIKVIIDYDTWRGNKYNYYNYITRGENKHNDYYTYYTILTEYEYDSAGRLINTEDHTYNMETGKKGKLVYKEALEYDGDILKKKIHYERSRYDPFSELDEDEDREFTITTEYFYGDSGRLIREEYSNEPNLSSSAAYTKYLDIGLDRRLAYTYNSDDAVIEQTMYKLIKKANIEYLDFDEVKPQM
ncbi:MAG: hypothetical protein J1F11_04240 [Oscillospiraceae bacterium]|nr:hypothetical protein [Oscillospiraceae bacterium]